MSRRVMMTENIKERTCDDCGRVVTNRRDECPSAERLCDRAGSVATVCSISMRSTICVTNRIHRMSRDWKKASSCSSGSNCLQTKLLRKPYMGNLYVRFDEGEGSAKSRPSLLYCSALALRRARAQHRGARARNRLVDCTRSMIPLI